MAETAKPFDIDPAEDRLGEQISRLDSLLSTLTIGDQGPDLVRMSGRIQADVLYLLADMAEEIHQLHMQAGAERAAAGRQKVNHG